jgi:hypothetical protein
MRKPDLINVTPEDELLLEWWNNKKKVSVYLGSVTIILMIWGPDLDTEMKESSDFSEAMKWLHD